MKIQTLSPDSPYLTEVIRFGSENSTTLGFLPKGAYVQSACSKQILIAIDNNNRLLGYLLYAINNRQSFTYIVHLCVDKAYRRHGVALALTDELKKKTLALTGIRVRCRRDYNLRHLWESLGFTVKGEMLGRGKDNKPLTIWWYDHGHPTLFTAAAEKISTSKVQVVLDANVFYDLSEPPDDENEESLSLLADWLDNDIEFCLTAEIYNEVDRHEDRKERAAKRRDVGKFAVLELKNNVYENCLTQLRPLFPPDISDSDLSDLRHLAYSIASGARFFITRDDSLLEKEESVYKKHGLRLLRPSDFIIYQDSLLRETAYQPFRLAGSNIQVELVSGAWKDQLDESFRRPTGESRANFNKKIRRVLSQPRSISTRFVSYQGESLGLFSIEEKEENLEIWVPLLRIARTPLEPTLARQIIQYLLEISLGKRRAFTIVSDTNLSEIIADALKEAGFIKQNNVWIKANFNIVDSVENIWLKLSELCKLSKKGMDYYHRLNQLFELQAMHKDKEALLRFERLLWPCKIIDLEIPSFVVPIKPIWAMDLFHTKLAAQDLFGGNIELLFNVENVYYRSSRPIVLKAPGRILWYISSGRNEYKGVKAISACSYIDEVVIDAPKALYSRYKRLGVYKWRDVLRVAGNRIDTNIMAFRFSGTEVFHNPIHLDELRSIWKTELNKSFVPRGPSLIPKDFFFQLYKKGNNYGK